MDTLFTSLIYSITIAFCLIMTYDFINGLDKLQPIDNVIGYIEVRFIPAQPVQYTPLPERYLRELVESIEPPVIFPPMGDILVEPVEPDPWALKLVMPATLLVYTLEAPVQLLLPPALEVVPAQIADRTSAIPTDYSKLTSAELRKVCSDRQIKWRNTRGSGKHMTKAEMVAALNT